MRLINADAIAYESIDSSDTGRHEHYYGTGIIAVRKEDIDAMPTIQPEIVRCEDCLYRKICSWEKQGAKFCSFAERREATE